jgi:transposase
VVEQCLDGGRVGGGVEVIEAAARVGVHRATVHRWVARYLAEQIGGWGIGSRRRLARRRSRIVWCTLSQVPSRLHRLK